MKALFFLIAILGFSSVFAKEKKTILHSNGRVQYEYETEGHMLDGRFSCYYENGKLRIKGQFSGNQKTGLWRVWDEKGLLRSERIYANNQAFTIVSECDSTGTKIKRIQPLRGKFDPDQCKFGDYLFSHRYLNSIERSEPNKELFAEDGLLNDLLHRLQNGTAIGFTDEKLEIPVNPESIVCYRPEDIVEVLVKEEFSCCAQDQIMINKLIAICPVIIESGIKKELGWVYAPEIAIRKDQLDKIGDHQYASTILKTTVNDPSFRLRDVNTRENDLLRLMLIEFEATAILYVIDQQILASH